MAIRFIDEPQTTQAKTGKIRFVDEPVVTAPVAPTEIVRQKPLIQRGAEAVMQTPERIARVAPAAGSVAGGMIPGFLPGIVGGVAGRAAGTQLSAELKNSPLRGLARMVEPAVPGLAGLTKPLSSEQQAGVVRDIAEDLPQEVISGVIGGLAGQFLRAIRPLGKYPVKKATEQTIDAVKSIQSDLGGKITAIVDDFPETPIDLAAANKILSSLPNRVISQIRKAPKIHKVAFLRGGTPVPTLKNFQALKEAIGDFITSPQNWEEATGAEIKAIRKAYSGIRDVMVEAQPNLAEPLKAYHDFMDDIYGYVMPTLKTSAGKLKPSRYLTAMKPGADEAVRGAFDKLIGMSNKAKEASQTINTILRRRAAGKVGKVAGKLALGAAGLGGGGYGIARMLGGQ